MRLALLLFAAYAFGLERCQRGLPAIQTGRHGRGVPTHCTRVDAGYAQPGPGQREPLPAWGMLAHKAYMEGTYDAQRPDSRRLHYMVDYWGDMLVLKHDRAVAHRGVDYIAARLKATGMRAPNDGVAYEAAREFIVKECNK